MTKTVLCAVDINRPKEEAIVLKQAAKMAEMEDAQLDVISVLPDFGATVVGAYFQDHDIETAKDKAAGILAELCSSTLGAEKNADIRHIIAVGSVYKEVLHTAEIDKADLIVIGSHDPDLKDYLLGPNAARIVRHCNCSVYVVRDT